jgi:hypothetical protein
MRTNQSTSRFILVVLLVVLSLVTSFAQETEPIWKFAQVTSDAEIIDMQTDSVGNCYLTGYFLSSNFGYGNDTVPGRGNESESTFILKTDPTGKLLWMHSMYGTNAGANIVPKKLRINERGDAVLIIEASNATVVNVGGDTVSMQADGTVSLIVKIAKNKAISWVRQIISTPFNIAPGVLEAEDMFIEESGNVFITGYFMGRNASISDGVTNYITPGENSYAKLFVVRIQAEGNVAWIQSCATDTSMGPSNIYSLIIRNNPGPSNNFFIGGYNTGFEFFIFGMDTLSFAQSTDAYIACYSKNGEPQWASSFRGNLFEYPEDITVMKSGEVVFLGHSNSSFVNISGDIYSPGGNYNLYLARYNSVGDLIKSGEIAIQKTILNSPGLNAQIKSDREENLIISSEFQSATLFSSVFTLLNPDPGTNDMFITRLSGLTFNPLWTFQGTSPGDNHFEGLHIDPLGNIYFSGTSFNNLNLGPTPVAGNVSEGTPYTARVNANGVLEYVFWQSNTVDNQIRLQHINSDAYGNTYVSGSFNGPGNLLGQNNLSALGTQGKFIAKYAYVRDVSGIVENALGEPLEAGYVKIYGYTFYQRSPLNDSVLIGSNGSFLFKDIPYGRYILVAQPTDASSEFYVQTYYPSAVYWEFGQQITINSEDPDMVYVITIQEAQILEGNTAVEGNLSDNINEKILETGKYDKGRPVKKAKIVLAGSRAKDTSYDIVATIETDNQGNFAFNDVEDGSYYIWADVPGLPVQGVYEINISGHQFVSNLNYILTEEAVIRAGQPEYSAINRPIKESDIAVYPNPCNDFIRIYSDKPVQFLVEFIDSKGVTVKHIQTQSGNVPLDISDILPGIYIVRILTEEKISFINLSVIR